MAVLSRVFLAAAAAALGVSALGAPDVTLTFDDIEVSNEEACGRSQLSEEDPYHGILVTGTEYNLVVNSTKTAACPSDAPFTYYPQWASSGSNVLLNLADGIRFHAPESKKLNAGFFHAGFVYDDAQLASDITNITVQIHVTSSDGREELTQDFPLWGAKNYGPWQVFVNETNADWIQVSGHVFAYTGDSVISTSNLIVDDAELWFV
ncbi:hypothetical protein GGI42DRAFT_311238 [Trichoderma sp. SZMC 28013]